MAIQIAVVGGSEVTEPVAEAAAAVGTALAGAGAIVVCGGLGGVMEAVCRGAKSAGGLTVGVLPGRDPTAANPWVDVVIATGLGEGTQRARGRVRRGRDCGRWRVRNSFRNCAGTACGNPGDRSRDVVAHPPRRWSGYGDRDNRGSKSGGDHGHWPGLSPLVMWIGLHQCRSRAFG